MPPKELTPWNKYGTGPIAGFAFERVKFSPLGAGLFLLFAGIIYAGILPPLLGPLMGSRWDQPVEYRARLSNVRVFLYLAVPKYITHI